MKPDSSLRDHFSRVRQRSVDLCTTLAPEDTVVQSMPDASPAKWHLAHVTWFFERFVLEHFDADYRRFDDDYHFLFNSYYYSAGPMHARPKRGLLTRPLLDDVYAWRRRVDEAMISLLEARADETELADRVILGMHHERQHQELLLTDIKHVFSRNPLLPAFDTTLPAPPAAEPASLGFVEYDGGRCAIGADGSDFCFDNELPHHDTLLAAHGVGNRLITNGEYRDFIRGGGYAEPSLWLSDGWMAVTERQWRRPLYWSEDLESEFTLAGQRDLDVYAPVCHVSYYEADAFARWAGARLPTEFEWESAVRDEPCEGNLMESGYRHPAPAAGGATQYFGDVWEWTSSAYAPYPGFAPLEGALGEYNGKFMCNQMTVRGGSCVTARDHIRSTYRSFFYPDARWQFLGIRLARDAGA